MNDEEITEQDKHMVKNLSSDVIQRFMGEPEFEKFMTKYRRAKLKASGKDRDEMLSLSLTRQERNALLAYLDDTLTPMNQLAESAGIEGKNFAYFLGKTALRVLYQNRKVVDDLLKLE